MRRHIVPEVSLLLSCLGFVFAGIHSHYFYVTTVIDFTSDIPTMPSYIMTRTLDDITLLRYDSDNEVVERKVPWFRSPFSTLLDASLNYYAAQRSDQVLLKSISNSLNHMEGFHVLQRLQGCAHYDNGTVHVINSYRYDGKPFMDFNVETAKFTAEIPEAEKYVQRFNTNATVLERLRNILVNTCIPHITELLSLGNCTFNRKEAPVVIMKHIPTDNGGVRLYCRAYGHYPKDISIMWYKNGQPISEEAMERLTLPLLDLTYLTSLSFNVSSVEDDVYTCKVSHSSMAKNFTQNLKISGDSEDLSISPSGLSMGGLIAICLAITLIVAVAVFGLVSFAKSRRQ
ncbi:major histocompatibility complex class I-related protein 1-like [Leptodactylus fuscus]|uniref:major histocompatibility complex class I-related protein 1-like n=1 Tax=Leptodactylus fuscus TaxID=238119 RepID=UPI003F4EC359